MKRVLEYGPALASEIQAFIKSKRAGVDQSTPWGADFLDRLLPFAAAGKLLRGSVVCFSYQAFSAQAPSKAVIKAAVALELTHSALLIHDDVMDNDDTRRGRPSLHRQYQAIGQEQGLSDSAGFGISMAVCGGDAAMFLAFELLAECDSQAEIPPAVKRLFVDQLAKVCAGQMQDIYFESLAVTPSKQDIYGLMRAKTASYTLALPLAMGAALAGRPKPVIQAMQAIGIAAGTIFQIRDDELGVMGTAAKLGKPVGSDIKEGKKTLLSYYLLEKSSKTDRQKLAAIFGNPKASPRDIAYVQGLVSRYGVDSLLNQEIEQLKHEAFEGVSGLDISNDSKAELKALVNFCASRQA